LDDYETNDKFEYCCTSYPFHVNCKRDLKRLKKISKGKISGTDKNNDKENNKGIKILKKLIIKN
jgi:hypothetical protein